MRRAALGSLFVVAAACGGPQKQESAPAPAPAHPVDDLAAEIWQADLVHDPMGATFLGDRRYDDRLPDLTAAAHDAWRAEQEGFLARLKALDMAGAVDEQRVTRDVLVATLEATLASEVCEHALWDVDQLEGWQVALAELGTYQIVDSQKAAAAYLARLAAMPGLFEQQIDNLTAGLEKGLAAPRIAVDRVIAQLEAMVKAPEADSPFLPAARAATGLSEADKARLVEEVLTMHRTGLVPAWTRYKDFLQTTYLPRARTGVGVEHNPNGAACYAASALRHTGAAIDAKEVHEIGMRELARLHGEMDGIATQLGASGWRALMDKLAQDPSQFLHTRDELLAHNLELVKKAEAALPKAFGRLPPWPCGVKAIEAFRENDAPAAYYYSASDDGSRPAYYYVNTSKPETRPLYNMEALAFHEALPGHHLQISIAQALRDVPEIRRHLYVTAFVEGWALYAELLADELGLYSSPETRFGMLNYQAWRAARLVVDTGMHALGWTREQALGFMMDNLAFPKNEMENEIDRYIIWPGQALAYMTGRMEIQRLRKSAEARLGARFDLKAFHDELLGHGPLPLGVLRQRLETWNPPN